MIRLEVKPSPTESYPWQHVGTELTIGRSGNCDLTLEGELAALASGQHVILSMENGKLFATDLGSTNGTFIGDKKIQGKVCIDQGDEIHIGRGGPRIKIAGFMVPQFQPERKELVEEATEPASQPIPPSQEPSGTQLLLVDLQKQNRRTLYIVLGIGLLGIGLLTFFLMYGQEKVVDDSTDDPEEKVLYSTPPEPSPKPTPPDPSPKPKPLLTEGEIEELTNDGIGWLGFVSQQNKYMYCNAWLASPHVMVTTAANAMNLQNLKAIPGAELIARLGDQQTTIGSVVIHPKFDTKEVESESNAFFNIALIRLDAEWSGAYEMSSAQADTKAKEFYALGWEPEEEFIVYDPSRVHLDGFRVHVAGRREHANQPSITVNIFDSSNSFVEGIPVFEFEKGQVVGMVARKWERKTIIPITTIKGFLDAER